MDGLKNGHYFGEQNQNTGADIRNATGGLNYQGGFNVNNLMLQQNMQNQQSFQNMQGFPNMGIQNLQGLANLQNIQAITNMTGNNDMQNKSNLQSQQRMQMPSFQGRTNAIPEIQTPQQTPGFLDYSQNQNDEHNMNYYNEYCRLYIANLVLNTQMNELKEEKDDLMLKLEALEKKKEELQRSQSDLNPLEEKKKRFRRTATEIERHYRCPISSCQKSYGSEGSLNQHLKLKHPEYEIPNSNQNNEGSQNGEPQS